MHQVTSLSLVVPIAVHVPPAWYLYFRGLSTFEAKKRVIHFVTNSVTQV